MKKRIKTDILLFIIAIPIALILFFVLDNPELLSASIISLQEQSIMKENRRDLWYKNEWNTLDVFLDDSLNDLDYVTISIIYDENEVSLNAQDIITQTDYEILWNTTWSLLIQFTNFSKSDYDYLNSLFELKYIWEPSILVGEAQAFLFSGINKILAIWSLNQTKSEHN